MLVADGKDGARENGAQEICFTSKDSQKDLETMNENGTGHVHDENFQGTMLVKSTHDHIFTMYVYNMNIKFLGDGSNVGKHLKSDSQTVLVLPHITPVNYGMMM